MKYSYNRIQYLWFPIMSLPDVDDAVLTLIPLLPLWKAVSDGSVTCASC